MSKGLGSKYIDRMKRYHVPHYIRDPRKRIEMVCDRAFYHDGAFKYKLPRYYKDRLFRKKFPCDAQVWNPKLKQYEKKIVYRYLSKNMLSLQMQAEIQRRILAEHDRCLAEIKSQNPGLSDIEARLQLIRIQDSAKKVRQRNLYSKSTRFYNGQRFKNREF